MTDNALQDIRASGFIGSRVLFIEPQHWRKQWQIRQLIGRRTGKREEANSERAGLKTVDMEGTEDAQ